MLSWFGALLFAGLIVAIWTVQFGWLADREWDFCSDEAATPWLFPLCLRVSLTMFAACGMVQCVAPNSVFAVLSKMI